MPFNIHNTVLRKMYNISGICNSHFATRWRLRTAECSRYITLLQAYPEVIWKENAIKTFLAEMRVYMYDLNTINHTNINYSLSVERNITHVGNKCGLLVDS